MSVEDLHIGFGSGARFREVVHGLTFALHPGRCVALVGESGSGKSATARTLVGLTGDSAHVEAGRLSFGDTDLRGLGERAWRGMRGSRIGFVLQDALVALDPVRPVGRDIAEALRNHHTVPRTARHGRVVDLLAAAGVPEPDMRARQRPGVLSGGLRQRALIASALAADPEIVIADEPTTALDATVQAQVLELLAGMRAAGRGILLISHDLSVVSRLADDVLVLQNGHIVERGPARDLLSAPQHPYTRALLDAVPGRHTRGRRLAPSAPAVPVEPRPAPSAEREPVLRATGLVKDFRRPDGTVHRAVDDVSFDLHHGQTLGIVGESGSGKSTTARLALALQAADGGEVRVLGRPWSAMRERDRRALRSRVSVVDQDPLSSFDPRWDVERILLDVVPRERGVPAARRRERVADLLNQVGLADEVRARHPLTLSGGQRQRVAIARALAPDPDVIVLDEAVSALDVSVQAQILDLLTDLQRARGVSYLFISHDLGVIAHLSDRVLVMQDGRVIERGDPEQVFTDPQHPYTRQLVEAGQGFDVAAQPAGSGAARG
nr:ABC transporter ATP-binding protein [Saccharopolyspora sp. HNM0983]